MTNDQINPMQVVTQAFTAALALSVLFLKCLGGETATVWVYGEY